MINKFIYNKVVAYILNRMNKNQSKIKILTYNDWMGLNILLDGFYEKDEITTISKYLNNKIKDGVFIDAGANIGNHSLFFSQFFNEVYSFEPQKKIFKILELNSSQVTNINTYNFGLGEKSETITFNIPFSCPAMASQFINSDDSYTEEVEIKNFDNEFIEKKISMVKIDTEGNELSVVKGMKNSLIKNKPVLCIEINQEINKRKSLLSFIKNLGYTKFYVSEKYTFPYNVSGLHYLFGKPSKLKEINSENILNPKNNFSLVVAVNENSHYNFTI